MLLVSLCSQSGNGYIRQDLFSTQSPDAKAQEREEEHVGELPILVGSASSFAVACALRNSSSFNFDRSLAPDAKKRHFVSVAPCRLPVAPDCPQTGDGAKVKMAKIESPKISTCFLDRGALKLPPLRGCAGVRKPGGWPPGESMPCYQSSESRYSEPGSTSEGALEKSQIRSFFGDKRTT